MRTTISTTRLLAMGATLGLSALPGAGVASAQGCSPTRFPSAVLGSQGDVYLSRSTWQVGIGFRSFTSNQFVVGHDVRNDLAANGKPSIVTSQSIFTSLTYGVSDRLSLTLNAPFSRGTHETGYADGLRHKNRAAGLGEISLSANYWLKDARVMRPGGNVAVGVGVKAPTGRNDVGGLWWKADGTAVPFPVHQSIELGDGGWGFIVQAQGFKPVFSRTYLYAGGSYTLNPKKTSDIVKSPGSTIHWAVPDTWAASGGASVLLSPEHGFSMSLGAQFNGTPRHDLIGRNDRGHRLPAIIGYLSPGLALTRGAQTISFGVPLRAYMDFEQSQLDEAAGFHGGGGVARYQILSSYSRRF